ncbi:serine/threonine protein kinase [Thermococcus sp.]
MHEENVIIKLARPDSPRYNLSREAEIIKVLEGRGITPALIEYGTFEGLDYLIRRFAPGEPILYADVEKQHLIEIVKKTALLDALGIDHGQIQGGKHIIIGKGVWIIDFEKAGFRKPKNLTSAIAMLFLNDNSISKRIITKFGLNSDFLSLIMEAAEEYKRSRNVEGILSLISSL